ncbi:MAG: hypothetical protein QXR62_05015 [Candidatus Bathyarchaeia archaeon]
MDNKLLAFVIVLFIALFLISFRWGELTQPEVLRRYLAEVSSITEEQLFLINTSIKKIESGRLDLARGDIETVRSIFMGEIRGRIEKIRDPLKEDYEKLKRAYDEVIKTTNECLKDLNKISLLKEKVTEFKRIVDEILRKG